MADAPRVPGMAAGGMGAVRVVGVVHGVLLHPRVDPVPEEDLPQGVTALLRGEGGRHGRRGGTSKARRSAGAWAQARSAGVVRRLWADPGHSVDAAAGPGVAVVGVGDLDRGIDMVVFSRLG